MILLNWRHLLSMTKMTNNHNNVKSNNYFCKFCGHQLHIKHDKICSFAGTLIDRISVNCPKCHIRVQKNLWKDNELILATYQTIMLIARKKDEK